MPTSRRWELTAFLIISAAAILSASQWPAFPYFLDSYYHLAVIQGFREAGGPVLRDFWEAAPLGRPHLYPPLFHLLFYPLSSAGVSPLWLAKFWSWLAFPLLLSVVWVTLRGIGASTRLSCLAVAAAATPYTLYLAAVNYLPATLALTAGCGILLSLAKKRWIAGGLLLGLAFWLHAGIPWLILLSLILFGLIEKEFRHITWKVIALGLLTASPWLLHLAHHLSALRIGTRPEERYLDLSIFLLILGLAGLKPAWQRRMPMGRFFVALFAGFLPMALNYRFRYFTAQGVFTWIVPAALLLDQLFEKIRPSFLVGIAVAGLCVGAPVLRGTSDHIAVQWGDTSLRILSGGETTPRIYAQPLFHEKLMGELAEAVRAHSKPEDLIFCNVSYLGGMLNVLTGRATTTVMLTEMREKPLPEQIRSARIIVWAKNPHETAAGESNLRQIISAAGLQPTAETELAHIFINPAATEKKQAARPVLPGGFACGLILLAVGAVIWDLKRA